MKHCDRLFPSVRQLGWTHPATDRVLRIAAAYGEEIDAERLPEILGVVGTALGFRALARQAVGVIPIAGWAVKGGIAYAATRAVGEAAAAYFAAGGTRMIGGSVRPRS